MSTQYPVLYDRPINKWKVTELKEELKRRNLMIKGLKDDLVRRLAEAIHNERENLEVQGQSNSDHMGVDDLIHHEKVNLEAQGESDLHHIKEPVGALNQMASDTGKNDTHDVMLENRVNRLNVVDEISQIDQGKVTGASVSIPSSIASGVTESGVIDDSDGTSNKMDKLLSVPLASSEGALGNSGAGKENPTMTAELEDNMGEAGNLRASLENRISPNEVPPGSENIKNNVTEAEMEEVEVAPIASGDKAMDNSVTKLGNENIKPLPMDAESHEIHSSNQVYNIKNNVTEAEMEEVDVAPIASGDKALDNSVTKLGNENIKPLRMDAESHETHPSDQVYDISSNLGSQVKCESITSDTLSTFKETEIKENLNADNVQLEPEVVKPEMVQPSFHKDYSDDGSFYALGDKVPDVKQGLVVEADDKHNVKSSEKTYSADDVSLIDHIKENKASDPVADDNELAQLSSVGNKNLDNTVKSDVPIEHMNTPFEEKLDIAASIEQGELQDDKSSDAKFSELGEMSDGEPLEKINLDQSSADEPLEKINLDQSSADDSMETKHPDSDLNPNKVGAETKSTEEIIMKDACVIEALQADIPANISESFDVNNDRIDSSSEKRKFEVEPALDIRETRKRLRRWNDESVKMPQQESSDVSLSTISVTTPNIDGNKPLSGGYSTNERVVPPSSKAPTNSLRIDNFLRPFTLKAVHGLLSKTGTFSAFWMDNIKTHCYVTYTSVDEAIKTRDAIYNLQWPANGGRLLIAEFVDPEEVKLRAEAPSQSLTTLNSNSAVPSEPPAKQTAPVHQQDARHAASDPPPRNERLARARSPVDEGNDASIVTLDDLFRKTKATPRIYYLPLTDEQVAVKLARQRK